MKPAGGEHLVCVCIRERWGSRCDLLKFQSLINSPLSNHNFSYSLRQMRLKNSSSRNYFCLDLESRNRFACKLKNSFFLTSVRWQGHEFGSHVYAVDVQREKTFIDHSCLPSVHATRLRLIFIFGWKCSPELACPSTPSRWLASRLRGNSEARLCFLLTPNVDASRSLRCPKGLPFEKVTTINRHGNVTAAGPSSTTKP